MGNKVSTKGQVTIEKRVRDALGVEAGWTTVQRVVDGHLEVHFFPPDHNRSLAGILAPYVKRRPDPDMDWHEIREKAWKWAIVEDMEREAGD